MIVWQRIAMVWCVLVSLIIGAANVMYMAGFGTGDIVRIGTFHFTQSMFFGLIGALIDVGMILGLYAMTRWNKGMDPVKWYASLTLFLMFSGLATHSTYQELQTVIGGNHQKSGRDQDVYESAKAERDTARAHLAAWRAELAKPGVDVAKMRVELAAVPPSERSRAATLSVQIERLEAADKSRRAQLTSDISLAEARKEKAEKAMAWSPVGAQANPIDGFEAYLAGLFWFAEIAGWYVYVGFGPAGMSRPTPRVTAGIQPPSMDIQRIPSPDPAPLPPANIDKTPYPRLAVDNPPRRQGITDEDIRAILKMNDERVPQSRIAKHLRIGQSSVSRIIKKHASPPVLGRMVQRATT